MTSPTPTLDQDLHALQSVWVGALPAGAVPASPQRDLEAMSAAGLMDVVTSVAQLRRSLDGLTARIAAEVARRSTPEAGPESLAKKQGAASAGRLIAITTGGSLAEAHRLIAVGTATSARYTLTGEELPPAYPFVADAVATGTLGAEAAVAIIRMLDLATSNNASLTPDIIGAAELTLVQQIPGLSLDQVTRLLKHTLAWLDPDGVEPRENELRDARSLRMWEDATGMVHLHAKLDPESAAPIKNAIEGIVTDLFRQRKHHGRNPGGDNSATADHASQAAPDRNTTGGNATGDNAMADPRTVPQMQADALIAIITHVLGCDRRDLPLATVTTIVRIDEKTLTEGVGHATIDGIDQPVSIGTARRIAARSGIIPIVLGTHSQVLDLGKARRLFTTAQRLALMERDGGCACCGLPPGYLQAHHIDWWLKDDGPTDLSNGVMLCPSCHARLHRDHWTIDIRDNQVWFTPPTDIDRNQTPRLGGRARYHYTHTTAA